MKHVTKFAGLSLALLAPAAFAATDPYAAITAAVDWSDVITGIGAIAALIAAVMVVRKGAKMLVGFLGR